MSQATAHVIDSVKGSAVLSSVTEYDAVAMAPWKLGEKVPYLHIARAFQAIDSTTKRLRIGDALANMFRSILALSPGMPGQLSGLSTKALHADYVSFTSSLMSPWFAGLLDNKRSSGHVCMQHLLQCSWPGSRRNPKQMPCKAT